MEKSDFKNIKFDKFDWLNAPSSWTVSANCLDLTTRQSDFWQKTYYGFQFNTGHVFGVEIRDDFTFEICVEAEFSTLYDQAGLMVYQDETHWLKAGVEYNDGQPMVSCVLTNEVSDWSTGVFTGNPRKFWLRVTKLNAVVCVKYSTDNMNWVLLRLCPFPEGKSFVGPMACSPKRKDLHARFTGLSITEPVQDILHSN